MLPIVCVVIGKQICKAIKGRSLTITMLFLSSLRPLHCKSLHSELSLKGGVTDFKRTSDTVLCLVIPTLTLCARYFTVVTGTLEKYSF